MVPIAVITVVLVLALGAALVSLSRTNGDTSGVASPITEPATSVSTPKGSGSPTTSAALGLADAVAAIRGQGFTPADTTGWTDSRVLNSILAIPDGAASPDAAQIFFFANGRLVGTDAQIVHTGPGRIEANTGDTVTIVYGIRLPSDPMCCPSGGDQRVTYIWDGTELSASGDRITPSTPSTVQPPTYNGHGLYRVVEDVTIRSYPTTDSNSMGVISKDTMVPVDCVDLGGAVDSPTGPNNRWLALGGNYPSGYVSAAFVDTGGEELNPALVPSCAEARG